MRGCICAIHFGFLAKLATGKPRTDSHFTPSFSLALGWAKTRLAAEVCKHEEVPRQARLNVPDAELSGAKYLVGLQIYNGPLNMGRTIRGTIVIYLVSLQCSLIISVIEN